MDYLFANTETHTHLIPLSEIIYCCTDSGYSCVNTKGQGRIVLSKTLNALAKELNDDFIRVSQKCLVNYRFIRCVNKREKTLQLADHTELIYAKNTIELLSILKSKQSKQDNTRDDKPVYMYD